MDLKEHQERERFFSAAKLTAVLTLASRVLGMVREMAITSLGASRLTDAFNMAFKVPNLFRRLFGEGALSAAFVPVFTETAEKTGLEAARRLLANAMGLLAVFLVCLMVAGEVGLLAWNWAYPGAWDRVLLLQLVGVMLPFMVTICLLALASAALNCRGHFAYPALAPILLNVFNIAAAWYLAPRLCGALSRDNPAQLFLIAASVTVAGVVQLVGVVWVLRRHGFTGRPVLRPVEPGIRQILITVAPMILGLGFLQISELLNDVIAWVLSGMGDETIHVLGLQLQRPLNPGVIARVNAAQRLYQFPMGVLAISLAGAVFPLLSRYAARNDLASLREVLNRALRLAAMEGLAAGTALFALAEPLTQFLYIDLVRLLGRHGRFTLADSQASAFVLQMYSIGLIAYCTQTIFLRAFYARKDTITPLKISCALVLVGPLLVSTLVWIPALGAGAFGIAMTVTATANVLVLAGVLRRRLGRFGGRQLAKSIARSALASAAMAAAIYLLRWLLAGRDNGLVVLVTVPAGGAAFLAAAWALRCPELGELFGRRRAPAETPDSYNGPGETPAP